jgi:aminopeptidase N
VLISFRYRSVKPVHYDISLWNLEFGGDWKYKGLVKIDTRIIKATKEIVLNAKELDIQGAKLWTTEAKSMSCIESGPAPRCIDEIHVVDWNIDEESAEASKISYDKKSERVTLDFPSEILPSQALLEINFTGILNSSMAGFYRSKYKPAVTPAASVAKDDEYHYMFSTHFEPCDARQAFPCFDEPNLKATFDFEIEIPEDQVALSNMPVKSVVEGKGKSGYKVVSFERTPVMSTYVSFAKVIISSDTDMEIISCSPGLWETLSMSKALRRGSTTARPCLFECTQREV